MVAEIFAYMGEWVCVSGTDTCSLAVKGIDVVIIFEEEELCLENH